MESDTRADFAKTLPYSQGNKSKAMVIAQDTSLLNNAKEEFDNGVLAPAFDHEQIHICHDRTHEFD
jgi:hypothetical protein